MKDVTPQVLSAELDAFAADVAPDQGEATPLLDTAFAAALKGRAALGTWYAELDDDQRLEMRPHIKELQATARRIDETVAPPPPHPEGAPDRSREQLSPHPPAPEGAPTDAEIERSQAMLEAVLGPEEIAKLEQDLPAPEIEVIKPVRGRGGRGWNWPKYADEMIAAAKRVPIDRLGQFRGANSAMYDVLHHSDREQWERVSHAMADYEREGAA